MNELYEKVDQLKNILDETKEIKQIKKLNQELKQDEKLKKLIQEYKENPQKEKKDQIEGNSLYRRYKLAENEVNFMILKIRARLKQISGKGMCQK